MQAERSPKSAAQRRFELALAALRHDPAHCVHRHITRAARVVGSRFDDGLAPSGLTAGQFTTLMTLARLGPLSIGRLAQELAMDSTTVPRVIRPLVARGWLEMTVGRDRRVRMVDTTEIGLQLLADALPAWERTQTEALASIDRSGWKDLRHGMASLRQHLRRTARRSA